MYLGTLLASYLSNMTSHTGNDSWKEDQTLKETFKLWCEEILDLVSRDFEQYTWSLRTLHRRLRYFKVEGPGKLLRHRALHKKIRWVYDMKVPRDLVHAVMYQVDPDALEQRAPKFKKKNLKVILYQLIPTLSTHLMGTRSWWTIKIVLFQSLSRGVLIFAAKRDFGWKFGYLTAIQILLDAFI